MQLQLEDLLYQNKAIQSAVELFSSEFLVIELFML